MSSMEIEKAKMMSLDMEKENVKKIRELFPNVMVEVLNDDGNKSFAVDFDLLKEMLGSGAIDDKKERYTMSWPDRKASIAKANKSSTQTLRPNVSKSKDFNNTKNIYIEGDNLEVLKAIRETYLGKIDFIYIDPPYNTGSDLLYDDDFSIREKEFSLENDYDSLGNKLYVNQEAGARFHTNWLNMIYPRLLVAKDLLTDDGVIFISIGENESSNLNHVCNQVFGERNFIACLTRVAKKTSDKGTYFKPTKDYIYVYAKNIVELPGFGIKGIDDLDKYIYEDEHGRYKKNGASLYQPSLDPLRGCVNQRYWIQCPDGSFLIPPGHSFPDKIEDGAFVKPADSQDKVWRWSWQSYLAKKDRLIFTKSTQSPLLNEKGEKASWNIYDKVYLDEKENATNLPEDVLYDFKNSMATKHVLDMGLSFSFSKPYELVKYLIELTMKRKDITIMDFFAGSASSAEAVLKLNNEDGGTRKFIMVQLPELCDEGSEAYQLGFKTICEISEERIRRCSKYLKKESNLFGGPVDDGFRVFELSSSNMNEVYYNPKAMTQNLLEATVDNIKPDRTPLDLLFQVMLECGALLSSKIEEKEINGKKVYIVEDNYIAACFDDEVDDKTVEAIAKLKPIYACFKGSSFNSDSANINAEQIFKTYSPNTEKIKVI